MSAPRPAAAWYPALLGVVVGSTLVGLVLPFAVGEGTAPIAATAGATSAATTATEPAAAALPEAPATIEGTAAAAHAPAGPGALEPGAGSPAVSAGQRTADGAAAGDVGVTPTEIGVGVVLLRASGLEQLGQAVGLPPPGEQRAAAQAFLDEINATGGVHGRRLVPTFATVDVLDQASERTACLAFTEDARVFAVIGTLVSQAGALCVTAEHGRPLVNPGLVALDETIAGSEGRMFTMHQRAGRAVANAVAQLTLDGVLGGRKIGIVGADAVDPSAQLADRTQELLRRAGHRVVATTRLSSDLSVAASQMPIEVRRMQAAGADVIVLLTPGVLATQFVQQAERQAYAPAYVATDFGPMSPDSSVQNMPRSFEGAHLVTATNGADHNAGAPPNDDARGCRRILEARTALRYDAGTNAAGLAMGTCAAVAALAAGLRGAGPGLGAEAFIGAIERAGRIPLVAPSWGGGSFGPQKHDLADLVRTARYASACRCWRPTSTFHPPHA